MANATNTLETNILTHLLRTSSWTKPSALYLALFTSACSDTALGTEVSGGSYARVDVSPADATWSAPSDISGAHTSSNAAQISFPVATASWGTVTYGALMTTSSGGTISDCLVWWQWTNSKSIAASDQVVINIGDLKISAN